MEILKAVQPKAQDVKEMLADGREVHFGYLMELCSIKPAREGFWICKGRIVFGGTLDEAVRSQHQQSEASRHLM